MAIPPEFIKGTDLEFEAINAMSKALKSFGDLSFIMKEPKVLEAIKESSKLFKGLKEAGPRITEIVSSLSSLPMTSSLLNMPTSIGIQGLDMLGATFIAPISGALSQAMGDLMIGLNETLGPYLQEMGRGIGEFVSEGGTGAAIGAGIGSLVGMFIPGGPFWTLLGALIGSAIEQLLTPLTEEQEQNARQMIIDTVPHFMDIWRDLPPGFLAAGGFATESPQDTLQKQIDIQEEQLRILNKLIDVEIELLG